ncbi:MAG: hypothetical protein ACXW4M_14685, partial [Anaerolineales bacterium]
GDFNPALTPTPLPQGEGQGVRKKLQNNRTNWMVSRKRIKFGVQVNAWSVDPDPWSGRIQNFDIHMNLCDGHSQRGSSVNDRVFAEQNDLAGRGGFHDK